MEAAGSGVGPAEVGGGGGGGAVALEFPAAAGKVPRRIRRRMMEGRSSPPLSAEEIEAKLREAGLRRQQFYEWLSSKARPKPRSPSWSSQDEDLGQRLEAKLYAAEQKRLSLLAKAQMRLARLDELRQAAKTGVEMRCEKEREELGTKVESRVQQAKENRMRLFKARMQRRAAAKERTAKSLLQMIIRQNKYRECVRSAISQKRAAAEKKRMGLLEAEKMRVRARVMQVCRVAETVCHQRESERRILKEQLENRLQRAKRQRAEFLRQRGSPHSATRIDWSKHGELLSRKLASCWRRFVSSKRSTLALARAFEALGINENSVKSMPFEQLALRIESATSLQTVKALLDRLECRFLLSQSYSASVPENIDHLLKRLASPNRKVSRAKASMIKGTTKRGSTRDSRSPVTNELSRYPMRVVLCAYMILGHPNAVFSGRGEREIALAESAGVFVREFELLIKIILDGPQGAHSSRLSSPNVMSDDWGHKTDSLDKFPCKQTFRSQLDAFDKAWRSYLYCFVVWKVKDARALEEDLVRAACQLELSMMQTCKVTNEGQANDLSHDMRAIQKQVTEDQQLLREKVQNLSGNAGIERMECALADTRSKFFEAKESGSPSVGPIAHISSPGTSPPLAQPLGSVPEDHSSMVDMKASRVVRSLFGGVSSSSKELHAKTQTLDAQSSAMKDARLPTENEILVNEIVHAGSSTFANGDGDLADSSIKAKVKETMVKAFWDGVIDLVKDESDYSQIVGLVKEVRDELYEMAPQSWKQEIVESIDLDILSQVLESGTNDLDYLGKILEFSLVMLQKLSAPAKESEMRKAHSELLRELTSVAQSDDKRSNSFVVATVKGLRFVLEQIQILKREISKARIQMMEPIIKGPAGLDYLQKAFSERYGSSSGAANSLPLTAQWISTLRNLDEEWDEHTDTLSALSTSNGLPPVAVLRTGSSNPMTSKDSLISLSGVEEQPGCNGEKMDIMLRLGLLKLSSQIEGLTIETVPETFKLNFLRLRSVQSLLQQIIVISTSMLVLRQIFVTENSGMSASELEGVISYSARRLSELLDNSPDAGIEDIIEMLAGSASEAKLQGKREVMTRVLTKSLQNDDPVFMKVSRSIYLAARGIVLGGSGARGRRLADAALRRVGASMLLDRVVKAAEILIVLATISSQVHGPWYRCLV